MDTSSLLSTVQGFTFHFDGIDHHNINVETLAAELNALNTLMLTVKAEYFPDTELKLKVVATERGSFAVDFQLLALTAATLFTPDNVEYATNALDIICSLFSIKKFLGGARPKKIVDTIEEERMTQVVENQKGEIEVFPRDALRILENAKIENSVINIVTAAQTDQDVTGITLRRESAASEFNLPRDEFEYFTIPVIDNKHRTQVVENVSLYYIKQVDFMSESMWKLHDGVSINAKILDEQWLKKFHAREYPIVPGVAMKARMRRTLFFGKDGLPVDNMTRYEVVEVLEIINPNDSQEEMLL